MQQSNIHSVVASSKCKRHHSIGGARTPSRVTSGGPTDGSTFYPPWCRVRTRHEVRLDRSVKVYVQMTVFIIVIIVKPFST